MPHVVARLSRMGAMRGRAVRRRGRAGSLYYGRILAWADLHRARTGQWPSRQSGPVLDAPWETWSRIDTALKEGLRGLRPGSSLALLLFERRGARHGRRLPPLTIKLILGWADSHHRRTGCWPIRDSGVVADAPGETWGAIARALDIGGRGLPPHGQSLAQLLDEHRGARNRLAQPRLSVARILAWADDHCRRTGRWPTRKSGAIPQSAGETWARVASAIRAGKRGLAALRKGPRRYSLARLLRDRLGVRHRLELPKLNIPQVMVWADDHFRRTQTWPQQTSGPVAAAPGETWAGIASALRTGRRGLNTRISLARLLHKQRETPLAIAAPSLSVPQIVRWARAHRRRTGQWPTARSGVIPEQPHETWASVNGALQKGRRGLPGDSSLAQVLDEHCGVRNPQQPPRLTIAQILKWADAHHARNGRWPSVVSGPVTDAPGETWSGINAALSRPRRGLPAPGCSLIELLHARRGARNRSQLPELSERRILGWADQHFARTGRWPRLASGPVHDAPGEAWLGINRALHLGLRGLPGGDSLMDLLSRRRGVRNPQGLPALTVAQIRTWARQHRQRTGEWPSALSGRVGGSDGETWAGIDGALRRGRRGLPRGLTVRRLLERAGQPDRKHRHTGEV